MQATHSEVRMIELIAFFIMSPSMFILFLVFRSMENTQNETLNALREAKLAAAAPIVTAPVYSEAARARALAIAERVRSGNY